MGNGKQIIENFLHSLNINLTKTKQKMKKATFLAVFAFVALAFTACTTGTSETTVTSNDSTAAVTDSTKCSTDSTCVDSATAPVK
jgi:hypothetical protein